MLLSYLSIGDAGTWQIPLIAAGCVVLLAILELRRPRQTRLGAGGGRPAPHAVVGRPTQPGGVRRGRCSGPEQFVEAARAAGLNDDAALDLARATLGRRLSDPAGC